MPRIMPPRKKARIAYKPKPGRMIRWNNASARPIWMKRESAVITTALVSGSLSLDDDIALNIVPTADLIGAYDQYRIKKVTLNLLPRYDPADGATVAANGTNLHVIAANDTTGQASAPASFNIVSQYTGYKKGTIASGGKFSYTFYPKVIGDCDNNGTVAAAVNYVTNPWLSLDTLGVSIPHKRLLVFVQSLSASNVLPIDYSFTVYFEVVRTR